MPREAAADRRCCVSIYGFCSATVSEDRLLRGPGRPFKGFLLVLTHKCSVVLWTDSPPLLTLISKYYISIVVCYISDKNHIIHPKLLIIWSLKIDLNAECVMLRSGSIQNGGQG